MKQENNTLKNNKYEIQVNNFVQSVGLNGSHNNFYKVKIYRIFKDNTKNFLGVIEITSEAFSKFLNAFKNNLVNFKLTHYYTV